MYNWDAAVYPIDSNKGGNRTPYKDYGENGTMIFAAVANYFKPGQNSTIRDKVIWSYDAWTRIYASGNYVEWYPAGAGNNDLLIASRNGYTRLAPQEFVIPPALQIQTQTTDLAYWAVLANAGAAQPLRDVIDERIVEDVKLVTGRLKWIDERKGDMGLAYWD